MYFKRNIKEKGGESYLHYRLCESYRDSERIRNRTLLTLGDFEKILPDAHQQRTFISRMEEIYYEGKDNPLPGFVDAKVEPLAHYYARELRELESGKRKSQKAKGVEEIYVDSIRTDQVRSVGSEWLCYQAVQQLGIGDYLRDRGWSEEETAVSLTHIISRAVCPNSELRTTAWIKENSAISELTKTTASRLTKDHFYQSSLRLYKEKQGLESYLSRRTNDLFSLDDNIIIYDLTNTYFEGSFRRSHIAGYGRSKEKRSDAKLVVLGAVINPEGFLKDSQILEGNMSDPKSLKHILNNLRAKGDYSSSKKQVVVIDAGIATTDNLEMITGEGLDYVCVSRNKLKNYTIVSQHPIKIQDKQHHPITIEEIREEGKIDRAFRVKSMMKAQKEQSMESRFTAAFETGMKQISEALAKKGGVKKIEKVWERIGRLKQKYPSVGKRYEIAVSEEVVKKGKKSPQEQRITTNISFSLKTIQVSTHGTYFLRTSLSNEVSDEELIWKIYNIIREVESTFRCLKTDLDLRPVYHKNDDAIMAHLHLGLLAYWIVSTIRFQLKKEKVNSQWKEIVRVMNSQSMVTTTILNTKNETIAVRKCSEPEENVKRIYDAIGYKDRPFIMTRKKICSPPT